MKTNEFLSEYFSFDANVKVTFLFGGNPQRRDEVIKQMIHLRAVNIYGTLSEQEGIDKILELK